MHESSKAIFQRLRDARYATRYFVGHGIDIGSGPDPLTQYAEFFPLMQSCRAWDLKDGDAELLETVQDNAFDFVHSAHCLEHMRNVPNAMANWLRVLKPGGTLVCLVPDEDLYEQGVFPSTFNPDHKHTFTIYKQKSWSPVSINLLDLFRSLPANIRVLRVELQDATYRYDIGKLVNNRRFDQTLTPVGECGIEFILRKERA